MDDIASYLMFMPAGASAVIPRDGGDPTAAATVPRGGTAARPDARPLPEGLRRLLADPKAVAALLRLANA